MDDRPNYAMWLKLCAYYSHIPKMANSDMLEPKAEAALSVIEKLPERYLIPLYDMLTENYKFFPMKEEILSTLDRLPLDKYIPIPERIGPDKQLTEGGAYARYCEENKAPFKCPDEYKGMTEEDFIKEFKLLNFNQFLKKYGFEITYRMVLLDCETWSEDQWKNFDRSNRERSRTINAQERGFYKKNLDDEKIKETSEAFHK